MNKLTVRDLDAAGKKVFVRVDFNVPIEDGKVGDDSRVRAAIPTIALLLSKGAAVILASHLGRPNGRVVDTYRLRPVAERLSMLLGRYVPITGDALGVGTMDAVNRLKPGQVLMLENLRFHSEEEANDPKFAKTLASYADAYVNDAFGTAHRAHASTVGITEYLPAYAGLLLEREVQVLSRLLESPERPFAAVLGGAKVSGKIKVLDSLTQRVDMFVVGGGMANTFLVAQGHTVGKSLLEKDRVEDARRVLDAAERKGIRFVLPTDVVVAKEVTRGAERKIVPAHKIPNSWSAVDIGPATRELFEQALEPARTVFWNGPLGVFEVPTFGDGTRAMARYLARRAEEGATVVVGGGDSVAAVDQLGLASKMTHISTGGGASLEFLENGNLPGIAALLDREPEEPRERAREEAPLTPAAAPAAVTPTPTPAVASTRLAAFQGTGPVASIRSSGNGAGAQRTPPAAAAATATAKPAGARPAREQAPAAVGASSGRSSARIEKPPVPRKPAVPRKPTRPASPAKPTHAAKVPAPRRPAATKRTSTAKPATARSAKKASPARPTRSRTGAVPAAKKRTARTAQAPAKRSPAAKSAKPDRQTRATARQSASAGKSKATAARKTGMRTAARKTGASPAGRKTTGKQAATKPTPKARQTQKPKQTAKPKPKQTAKPQAKATTRRGGGSTASKRRSAPAKRTPASKPATRRSTRSGTRRRNA